MIQAESLFYDRRGQLLEGTIQVKYIGEHGPYGYRVIYQSATKGEGSHDWEYLGLAEPGLSCGSYPPGTPLVFYRGRARNLEDKTPVFVGNWDGRRTNTSLDDRLEEIMWVPDMLEVRSHG